MLQAVSEISVAQAAVILVLGSLIILAYSVWATRQMLKYLDKLAG